MEQFFLKRFEKKSASELKQIIDSPTAYQPEAVTAAMKLLDQLHNQPIEIDTQITVNKLQKEQSVAEKESGLVMSQSFDLNFFRNTYRPQAFFSTLTLACLFHAFHETIKFYSNERWVEGRLEDFMWYGTLVALILNHAFFKVDIGTSNNLIGRVINDIILLALMVVVRYIYVLVFGYSWTFDFDAEVGGFIFLMLFFLIVLFAFEGIIAAIKVLLRWVRWEVL
ncbi:MAG: hypothetical protein JXQ90_15505 [Cyclobacteriaceae bacterium]